ncbi:MAG: phosphoenolpyruvate carboxykinase (GTP) [Gammaproteobacteria bacterium]|nr:phosphoenolpyruvate carboxykinase (GTP) [Gammaproteobacteria bacterium]MCP5423475.1 phosphoenolpyruvate carboxykinase (GTP) [Gammaproteobacteria bacterium]MCP5458768.1 phosphoenolpyruvate carboxykinase (GTP) [Gammaproteobacteria bacterium]
MSTTNQALQDWVTEVAHLTKPARIHWCDGSQEEYQKLVRSSDFMPLNPETHPDCYYHRSDPTDVARTEHLTFICTRNPEEAGPNNYWMDPAEANEKLEALFAGCMRGRTMFVIPYCMGPLGSPLSRYGVEITDSPYVAANMRIMTRMGSGALKYIEEQGQFVKALHSLGDLSPDRRFIMHFPEESTIKSIGSGYGGNALLGKKCHALRLGSWQAREQGWLAEHMLIVGIENPQGETHYVAAAFPSACGKTNLAMLIPPETMPGYKVWTVGDDIAWMRLGEDGRLWAINPEAGYFGVAPGTGPKTNANAVAMLNRNAIFTNVGLTEDNRPWWEGLSDESPKYDWRGTLYNPDKGPAAQPNSRFTVPSKQCPSYSPHSEDLSGVPISAIVFGGRRAKLAPLVYQAKDWNHGVLVGAGMASETTAAATAAVGVVRRDPMAMKPFCGYNYADYWAHWLSFAEKSDKLPKVFHVNWFRQDDNGKFMWPGFGENLRVLEWIVKRCQDQVAAVDTPIGYMPRPEDINTNGLKIAEDSLQTLLSVDTANWLSEMGDIRKYFADFGGRMPQTLLDELAKVIASLESETATA